MSNEEKIIESLKIALKYAGYSGSHHKSWVLDQMVRILAGDQYDAIITNYKKGDDGPETYYWQEGIGP